MVSRPLWVSSLQFGFLNARTSSLEPRASSLEPEPFAGGRACMSGHNGKLVSGNWATAIASLAPTTRFGPKLPAKCQSHLDCADNVEPCCFDEDEGGYGRGPT